MSPSSISERQMKIEIEAVKKYIKNLKSNILCATNINDKDAIISIIDVTAHEMAYDNANNTRYYSIQEFAIRIGVSVSTLRLWDKQNKLKPHHKTVGGHRIYSEEQACCYISKGGICT